MSAIIVVPVYKQIPSEFEIISFKRCLRVFSNREICMVYPVGLDLSFYIELSNRKGVKLKTESFSALFFSNIESYNRLMMDMSFYNRFKIFDYILIYQLDAYAFDDQLDEWIAKGYDYIGAPWFDGYKNKEEKANLWAVGNGGFSLRNVQSFIKVLENKKPIKTIELLKLDYSKTEYKGVKKILVPFLILNRRLGYKNSIEYWKTQCGINEDFFWTIYLDKLGIGFKKPSPEEAAFFAFEQSPGYLFVKNCSRLPFGCHAWQKYEYETFWKNIILDEE